MLDPGDGHRRPALSTYTEHRVSPHAGSAIACTWEGTAGRPRTLRVLPDGCADLAWDGTRLRIAPPRPGPVRYPVATTAHGGLRVAVGWVATVLRCDVTEVEPGTPLADVLPPAVVRSTEHHLAAATSAAERRAALVRLVEGQLDRAPGPDPRVLRAALALAGEGRSVVAVARDVGVGERQLRRLFARHVGLTPEAFRGVARFQRFLRGIRAEAAAVTRRAAHTSAATGGGGRTLARWAAECGYYDQSHLVRACRQFAGAPPSALTAAAGRRRGG